LWTLILERKLPSPRNVMPVRMFEIVTSYIVLFIALLIMRPLRMLYALMLTFDTVVN